MSRPTFVAAIVLVAAGLAACSSGTTSEATGEPAPPGDGAPATNAVVVGIVDGDTLDAAFDGVTDRVRLLGIDTPESVIPGEAPECFGPEAGARLAELLPEGTPIRVERDVEPRDRFGRVLGYVHRVDGVFVNLVLIDEGYAETLSIDPNTAHRGTFGAAADAARRAGRGLWGACG